MKNEKVEESARDLVEAARDSSRSLDEVFARSVVSTLNHPANQLTGMTLVEVLKEFLPIYREACKMQDKPLDLRLLAFNIDKEGKPN